MLQGRLEGARFAYLKNYNYHRAMTCGRGSAEIITVARHLTGPLARYRSHVGQAGGFRRRRVDSRD
jgi:hypothetical protein